MIATTVVEITLSNGGAFLVDDRPDVLSAVRGVRWSVNNWGYVQGAVGGRTRFAHRVVWEVVRGPAPPMIDHIDRNPRNCTLSNLRAASPALNARNTSRAGVLPAGVRAQRSGRYQAAATIRGAFVDLGTFPSVGGAAAAAAVARARLIALEAARAAVGLSFAEDGMPPPPRTAERSAWLARWRSLLTAPDAPNEYADLPLFHNPLEIHG
jgi:hypothetical protein